MFFLIFYLFIYFFMLKHYIVQTLLFSLSLYYIGSHSVSLPFLFYIYLNELFYLTNNTFPNNSILDICTYIHINVSTCS